jgi:hypothetical protein
MKWFKKLFKKDYNNPLCLWQICEDAFQEKYPEPRNDLYVSGEEYNKILQNGCGFYTRNRFDGEIANEEQIKRNGRIIWEIGDVVSVSNTIKSHQVIKENNGIGQLSITIDPKGDEVYGRLKLIAINNVRNEDILELIRI